MEILSENQYKKAFAFAKDLIKRISIFFVQVYDNDIIYTMFYAKPGYQNDNPILASKINTSMQSFGYDIYRNLIVTYHCKSDTFEQCVDEYNQYAKGRGESIKIYKRMVRFDWKTKENEYVVYLQCDHLHEIQHICLMKQKDNDSLHLISYGNCKSKEESIRTIYNDIDEHEGKNDIKRFTDKILPSYSSLNVSC